MLKVGKLVGALLIVVLGACSSGATGMRGQADGGKVDGSTEVAPDAPAEAAVDSAPSTLDAAAEVGTDAATDVAAEAPVEYDAGAGCTGPGVEAPLAPAESGLPATGLVLWVRGDRGIYKTAQNGVCAWLDQSGMGNDLHPATTRPTWEATAVGGKPAVHNAAVGQEMSISGVLGVAPTSGRTFIAVSMLVAADGRYDPIIQGQSGSAGTYIAIDSNTWMTVGNRDGAYLTNNSFDTALATSTSPRVHVLTIPTMTPGASVTTALDYRVDGAAQALTLQQGNSGGVIQSFADANFTSIGVVVGTTSAGVVPGNGYIAEAIIYDRPLTANETSAVEAALKARYGIP
ncbi:MAG TPA: hypothetical protein VNO55_12345 [Polyangia bacterium]|nr:hypothetical protein [Polyangia bacterium]